MANSSFWGGLLIGVAAGMAIGTAMEERISEAAVWPIRITWLVLVIAGVALASRKPATGGG